MDFDLIIRGGTIVDGSGASPFLGDVGVADGKIVAIGTVAGTATRVLDASGAIVTPGFVDVHTHYDGQATWEHQMRPSSQHGVTTVVTGNCGVGFAPCEASQRETMVKVMEGVEDIPEVVMTRGVPWEWRTFPEYLDFLDKRSFDVDVGTQLPHSCVRVFVMGERGASHEPPTPDDLAQMRMITAEAISAGALGVSTSRSFNHRTKAGELAPSVSTEEQELMALAEGLREAGSGVFQLVPNTDVDQANEAALIQRIARKAERPLSFTMLQTANDPEGWRSHAAGLDQSRAEGLPIKAQILVRPVGIFMGLDLSLNPFSLHPAFKEIESEPLETKVRIMRDPEFRAQLLSERSDEDENPVLKNLVEREKIFSLGNPPVYDPPIDQSLLNQAKREGVTFQEKIYDALLEDEGRALLYVPGANFIYNSLDVVREMMGREDTVLALGDGGAHYGMICDASWTTYTLLRWVRDAEDPAFALPTAVRALSALPAGLVGLNDRGQIGLGMKADLNVIDYERLALHRPSVVRDLPEGGRRLQQRADGFRATVVSGVVTYQDGEPTGALPGRLVRHSRPTPLAA